MKKKKQRKCRMKTKISIQTLKIKESSVKALESVNENKT